MNNNLYFTSSLYINSWHKPKFKTMLNFILKIFNYEIISIFNSEVNKFIRYELQKIK